MTENMGWQRFDKPYPCAGAIIRRMRRWLAIAALSAAVQMAVPSLAQMHGGGSRGGGSMGRGGFSSSGFHGGGSMGAGSHFGATFISGIHQPVHSGTFGGFHHPFFGPRHFGNRTFFSTFSPGFYGYYGYPGYYGGGLYPTADYYPSYDYYGSSYYSAQNDVAQQQQDIDRLEDEVARLREQRESQQREAHDVPAPEADRSSVVSTPTLLVFRDKHTQEVQNYAIVGGTLWIFSEQRATKLPLSWLDPEATSKANEDRGVDFQLPK
jgi:hypothetical protein